MECSLIKQSLDQHEKFIPSREVEFSDTSFPLSIARELVRTSHLKKWHTFAETRVLNSHELSIFAKAGFEKLQIGIESLNSRVLSRMCKGATLLDNLCCLRESWNTSIKIDYNIILDMPCTSVSDIEETLSLLPLIHHLPPPTALIKFALQRGSPIFVKPEHYGLENIRPHQYYQFLGNYHPHFYYDFDNKMSLSNKILEKAHNAFLDWYKKFDPNSPLLLARLIKDKVLITDRRFGNIKEYSLLSVHAQILKICRNPSRLNRLLTKNPSLNSVINDLENNMLILHENDYWLSLPVLILNDRKISPQIERDEFDSWFAPDS